MIAGPAPSFALPGRRMTPPEHRARDVGGRTSLTTSPAAYGGHVDSESLSAQRTREASDGRILPGAVLQSGAGTPGAWRGLAALGSHESPSEEA